MITGTVFGVVLNDAAELEQRAGAFSAAPYHGPPVAPVVYIKPGNCVTVGGAPVPVPRDQEFLVAAATLALVFGRDTRCVSPEQAMAGVAGVCLALDVSVPADSYYRPAISQRCRDGFLPLGRLAAPPAELERLSIATRIDGAEAHRWTLARLHRPIPRLIADLSAFMTLQAGDVLLVGLAGDAPRVARGQRVFVHADGLPTLDVAAIADCVPA